MHWKIPQGLKEIRLIFTFKFKYSNKFEIIPGRKKANLKWPKIHSNKINYLYGQFQGHLHITSAEIFSHMQPNDICSTSTRLQRK